MSPCRLTFWPASCKHENRALNFVVNKHNIDLYIMMMKTK